MMSHRRKKEYSLKDYFITEILVQTLLNKRVLQAEFTVVFSALIPLLVIFSILYPINLLASEDEITKDTSTSFTLAGTIASSNSQAFALIQVNNERIRFYSTGDKIRGYKITQIHRNKILLSRNNKTFILHLHQKINYPTNQVVSKNTHSAELPEQILIKLQLLDHIRKNIQEWLNAVALKLEITDGRVSGYVVESIGKIPLNASIGLMPGDIIKSVNGILVSQPDLFSQTIDKLLSSSDIYVQIERGHKTNILNFHVSE